MNTRTTETKCLFHKICCPEVFMPNKFIGHQMNGSKRTLATLVHCWCLMQANKVFQLCDGTDRWMDRQQTYTLCFLMLRMQPKCKYQLNQIRWQMKQMTVMTAFLHPLLYSTYQTYWWLQLEGMPSFCGHPFYMLRKEMHFVTCVTTQSYKNKNDVQVKEQNKFVFSFLHQLTTWHRTHLLISAGRATSSNISSLQGQQQQTLDSGGGQMTGQRQTDGWRWTDGRLTVS